MNSEELKQKRNRILSLQTEIEELKRKQEELCQLESEYYHEYYDTKREDFAHLTDIPRHPDKSVQTLWKDSMLNVDTVGKIICQLLKRYEKTDFISKRLDKIEKCDDIFNSTLYYPVLVIGNPSKVDQIDRNSSNIIIDFSANSLKEYPTKNPIVHEKYPFGNNHKYSNYNHLLGYFNGLSFDHKGHDYIEELIYSLAYYQREHSLKTMSPSDTWNVYRKIYKK